MNSDSGTKASAARSIETCQAGFRGNPLITARARVRQCAMRVEQAVRG
jgi:hypothetical protein